MKSFVFLTLLFLVCFKNNVAAKLQNILLIVVDDLRPSIGVYGDKDAFTPNIDQLANQGVVFEQAFAQQALCAPSRNSFLTSRRPDTLHLYDFYNYWRTFAGNFTTLPQFFKENSYFTKSIGKIFHPGISSNFSDDYPLSWSEKPWHPSTEIFKDSAVCPTSKGWFANLICPVKVQEQPEGTLPDIQSVQEGIKFLNSQKMNESPFFLAVGLHKPHIPFKFPKKYADLHPIENITLPGLRNYPPGLPTVAWNPWTDIRKRDDIAGLNVSFPFASIPDDWAKRIRQAYFSSVSYIDDLIGELLQSLKAVKLHRNTIVILLGDHGWSLGEHGEWSKYSNFDAAVRVPLIIRIPNLTYMSNRNSSENQAIHINSPVELVDIFPTLVDLADLKPIPKCPKQSSNITLCSEGKSLKPLILHKINSNNTTLEDSVVPENYALSQYPRPGVQPTNEPNSDKPHLNEIKFMGYSIRTLRYRYTEWISWDPLTMGNWSSVNQTELYDHHIDVNENLNVAGRPGLETIEKTLSNLLKEGFGIKKRCFNQHACAVVDGASYGVFSGFLIGAAVGAVYGKFLRVPRIKPVVMQNGISNAIFGGTFFGILMAYKHCL